MSLYLRKPGGEVYGPIDFETLSRWASDGRVMPEDEVSADQQAWSPAHSREELCMDWTLELGDASYGPLPLLAFGDLLRGGSVSADHTITHKGSGAKRRLGDAMTEALLDENARLRQALESAAAISRPPDDRDRREALTDLQNRLDAAHADATRLEADLAQWKQRVDDERARAEMRETELAAQLAEATRRELAAQAQRDELDRQAAELKNRIAAAGKAAAGGDDLAAAYHELSQNFDRLTEQLSARTSELKAAQEARASAQQDADDRIRIAEDKTRRMQSETDDIRRKLAELAESHTQLVRAYRDLNDRFIRAHQPAVTATSPGVSPAPQRPAASPRSRRA